MCCTIAKSRMTKTILYAGEIVKDDTICHVLGYQNTVQNLASGPNAMILHFPAKSKMGPENIIDVGQSKDVLKQMKEAVIRHEQSSMLGSRGIGRMHFDPEVFDHDIYTIVLAQRADDVDGIRDALLSVTESRRPEISVEILEFYARQFPSWPLALCCFDNKDAKDAAPMLWHYEPKFPDVLFAPALDAHDGKAPDLQAEVDIDHTVIFGSSLMEEDAGQPVEYGDVGAELRSWLSDRVIGATVQMPYRNADFVAKTESVRSGSRNSLSRRILQDAIA